jgi:hypothetical protein
VVAALVVYLPALGNGFIWDDPLVLQQLRAIRAPQDLFALPAIIPKYYFRPVVFASYLFDRWIGGEAPFWFHASVIATHAFNTLLVFLLASRLFPANLLTASGGALLFAVLPTHVESVAWMAGRSDVIVCTFIIATVLLMDRRTVPWTAWAGGFTALLAFLSKEMALALAALVPGLDLLATRRLFWRRYAPLLIAIVTYFLLRQQALGTFVGGQPVEVPVGVLAADLLRALGYYVVQALLPVHLSAYVPAVPSSVLYLAFGAGGLTAALAAVLVSFGKPGWGPAYLAAWFFITLAPSLTVIIRRSASAVVADRYLYVPTVASCILVAWAIVRVAERRRLTPRAAILSLAGLTLLCSLQVIRYNHVWRDNLSFWTDVVAKAPGYTMPQRELAAALVERGRLSEAEPLLQAALAGTSDREGLAMTYNNLGNLYRRMERYDDAVEALQRGINTAPHPMLYHNLGMALMKRIELADRRGDRAAVVRDMRETQKAFTTAIQLAGDPAGRLAFAEWNPAKSHALLGQVLFSLGDRAGAREHLEMSLRLEPAGPSADATRQYLKRLQ